MTTDRFNLYQAVHKGLRAFMTDTLVRVGHTDPTDVQACTDCAEQVRTLLHVCGEHLHLVHENRFIHTALERRAPGSAQQAESNHADHVAEIAALRGVGAGRGGITQRARCALIAAVSRDEPVHLRQPDAHAAGGAGAQRSAVGALQR